MSGATLSGSVAGIFAIDNSSSAIGRIQLTAALPVGVYTFTLNNVRNTATSGSYKAIVSTQGYTPLNGNNTESAVFTIGTSNDSSPDDITNGGGELTCDNPGTVTGLVVYPLRPHNAS